MKEIDLEEKMLVFKKNLAEQILYAKRLLDLLATPVDQETLKKNDLVEEVGNYYCHDRARLIQHIKVLNKLSSNSDSDVKILKFLQEEKIKSLRHLGEKLVGQTESTLLKVEHLIQTITR